MEFGDLSSLGVEYPNYNSMGQFKQELFSAKDRWYSSVPEKFTADIRIPEGINGYKDLAGRAIILTETREDDLISYGVITDESFDNQTTPSGYIQTSTALCENIQSTV
jgi:hypothetical protein